MFPQLGLFTGLGFAKQHIRASSTGLVRAESLVLLDVFELVLPWNRFLKREGGGHIYGVDSIQKSQASISILGISVSCQERTESTRLLAAKLLLNSLVLSTTQSSVVRLPCPLHMPVFMGGWDIWKISSFLWLWRVKTQLARLNFDICTTKGYINSFNFLSYCAFFIIATMMINKEIYSGF